MKLSYLNTSYIVAGQMHGRHAKDLVVLHETVSGDVAGVGDMVAVERYLAGKGYGIHGMTDAEGNICWARSFDTGIFWQCGGVNERSIGIEQVSMASTDGSYWINRQKQLRATAKLLAAIHNSVGVPLKFSDGRSPGVTGHWCVSQWAPSSEGHRDVHPKHLGGNYPLLSVLVVARGYAKLGYTL